jgi:O-antigen/teichoic acid export membrane protein
MSRQLVARNSALMFAAQLVARVSGLVVFACVARFLSVDEVGLFGYAMTMVGFLTIAVDFGFDLVVTREAARGSGSEGAGLALRLKTIHFLVAFPVLLVAAALQTGAGAGLAAVAILGAAVWHESGNRTVAAFYLAQGRAEFGMVAESLMSLLRLLLVPAVLVAGGRLVGVTATYYVASAVTVLLLSVWAWRNGFRPSFASPPGEARRVFGEAAAFAAYGLLYSLSFRLDIVLLKGLRSDNEVGLYFAAFRVTEAMLVLPAVLTGALYPVLSRLDGAGDRASFSRACAEATRWLAVAGIGAALAVGGAAPLVIRLIAGPGYEGAVEYLRWLLPSFVLICIQCVGLIALNAAGRQRSSAGVMLIAAVVKVGLNLALIPAYGALGACFGSVVTSAIITVHLAIIVRRSYPAAAWLRAWAGAAIAGSAALAASAIAVWAPLGWRVVLSLVVFMAVAVATRAAKPGDLSTIRDLWRSRAAGAAGGV